MEPEAGKVEIARSRRAVQNRQDVLDALNLVRPNPPAVSLVEESLKAAVPEFPDHRTFCNASRIT